MLGLNNDTGAVLCTQHPTVGMSKSALSHWLLKRPDMGLQISNISDVNDLRLGGRKINRIDTTQLECWDKNYFVTKIWSWDFSPFSW